MVFKVIVLCSVLAAANAGLIGAPIAAAPTIGVAYSPAPAVSQVHYTSPLVTYGAPLAPAITSQSANIYRSFGNLGQISTYSKSIDTPFSSVQKADVRISNPGLKYAGTPAAIGVAYSAAPAVSQVHYNSPIVTYGAPLGPTIASQDSNIYRSFGNLGQISTYSKSIDTPFSSVQKADVRISNPGLKIAEAPAAIGIAYSAAPAVSHFAYTGNYGLNYAY